MAEKEISRELSESSSNGSPNWEAAGDNIFRRRTSSVNEAKNLPRLKLPVEQKENSVGEGVFDDEVEEEGKELFGSFVADSIKREGLDVPETLSSATQGVNSARSPVSPPSARYKHLDWAWTGKKLKKIAKNFEKSKERIEVKDKAKEVYQLAGKGGYGGFRDLLTEFFREGMTLERIVILFLFCSDLAILALKNSDLSIFEQLIAWSLRYITTKICGWVRRQGGWDAVVWGAMRYVPYVALVGAAAAAGIAVLYYWFNGRAEIKK